ncbi:MAG: phosphoesterase [Alphaproteobacteria bacterium]|nr:phosphoesterase [Alphaproteobacteria bacterium]MAX97359.1 phosphoesterase [Alphaproteobacteria bacterium]
MAKTPYVDSRRHEYSALAFLRDTRTLGQMFFDAIKMPQTAALGMFVLTGIAFTFPALADIALLAGGGYLYFMLKLPTELPYKLPAQTGLPDPHDVNPGTGKAQKADGILYFGNDLDRGDELWFSNSDARTHFLILGTTGSGKTETLVSMSSNALSWGSGFLYCDGKGDTSLWGKIYSLARRFGRDDDVLILNFMTGNSDGGGESNTFNPFARGSAGSLTEMLVSLMDDPGKEGDMWKGRAISLLTAIMMAVCKLRDDGKLLLNIEALGDFLNLPKIVDLYLDKHGTYDLPPKIRSQLKNYLDSLPGFDWNEARAGRPQAATANDQHGYLQMQFTRILTSLSGTYGHIFDHELGDIDVYDIVVNRRILLVLLPALEKSEDELANIGKIVVASLKGMMSATLGAKLEGDWSNVISTKPTNSASPFLSILDEVGYYTVPGMAVMAAQARSLGFSMVFAAQDVSAMKKRSEKEAESIIANCNIKSFMKLEDPEHTNKLFDATAGTFFAAEVSGFTMDPNSTFNNYNDIRNASVRERRRSEFIDLRLQSSGESHTFFGGKMVRVKMYYANPPSSKRLRYNRFIPIRFPDPAMTGAGNVEPVLERLRDPNWTAAGAAQEAQPLEENLSLAVQAMQAAMNSDSSLFNAAGAAIGTVAYSFEDAAKGGSGVDVGDEAGESGGRSDQPVAYMPAQPNTAPVAQMPSMPSMGTAGADDLEGLCAKIWGDEAADVIDGLRAVQAAWVDDDIAVQETLDALEDAATAALDYPDDDMPVLPKRDDIPDEIRGLISILNDEKAAEMASA